MEEKKKEEERKDGRLSYEQLNDAVAQLSAERQQAQAYIRQLQAQIERMNMTNVFKRLEFLFRAVEDGHLFSSQFMDRCVAEIESTMTIPEEKPAEESGGDAVGAAPSADGGQEG